MDQYILELIETIKGTIFENEGEEHPYQDGIVKLIDEFTRIKNTNKKVFFIGNGGSAAIATHMTADFMKNGGMNTYNLFDSAVTTCMGNDYGYHTVFSKPLDFLMDRGDLLVAISSSGKSANIIEGVKVAANKGARIITFTGFSQDNPAKQSGDFNVYVPSSKYGIVESIHNLILQEVVDNIMERDGVSI